MLERFHRELLNFLSRQLRDRDAAADLVQESYARVLAARHGGAVIADARALLYRTARNLVIDQHRRAQHRHAEDLDALEDAQEPAAPEHLQPDVVLAARQQAQALLASIDALPPRCREAFVLHKFDGLPQAEVARRMGISLNMVEKHIIRAMLACRRSRDQGGSPV